MSSERTESVTSSKADQASNGEADASEHKQEYEVQAPPCLPENSNTGNADSRSKDGGETAQSDEKVPAKRKMIPYSLTFPTGPLQSSKSTKPALYDGGQKEEPMDLRIQKELVCDRPRDVPASTGRLNRPLVASPKPGAVRPKARVEDEAEPEAGAAPTDPLGMRSNAQDEGSKQRD